VEDLFNLLNAANLDLELGLNGAGNGITISSRLSGANFSIGEDAGTQAAGLGVRTLVGSTLLADLNLGRGVPVHNRDENGNLLPAPIQITRRDGTTVSVDLKGLFTVQEVINAINAVDPGVLVASLNSVGNGISLVDNDGVSTGPLVVAENAVSTALGIAGSETGTNPAVALAGQDVNPTQAKGVFSILVQVEAALRAGDDAELSRLDALLDREIERFNLVRGEVGARLKTLESVENRLLDEEVSLQEALSKDFDSDLTEVITQVARITSALQATMQVGAISFQLSLLNFL
jgi:flagellar hook-associated protein 3 FlgL